ncbi:hypothetical protein GW17_00046661 [Ensete ventricosum]|nr:hypothetical protein GW17_00046661 [Ensete ventricosum]
MACCSSSSTSSHIRDLRLGVLDPRSVQSPKAFPFCSGDLYSMTNLEFDLKDAQTWFDVLARLRCEVHLVGSPSSHQGKSTLKRRYDESVTCSSFFSGFSLRSKLSPRYDLFELDDQPNLNFVKRARSLSSIRVSKASNLAPIKFTDAMA